MQKYLIAATYSAQAMAGWIKEPGSDRVAAANGAASKVGGKVVSITFVRGKYDFIAEFELPNFEAAAALKMITMSSGAFSEMEIMEPVDLNQIAKSASSAAGEYKAVGK
jgi:uncharacterized protein with GYD domain